MSGAGKDQNLDPGGVWTGVQVRVIGVPGAVSAVSLSDRVRRIHEQALEAARSYRKAESLLIDALIAVDQEKVFKRMGYPSLFAYSCLELGLTESVAANAITVSRKAREVPALQSCIRAGVISISKAKKITSVLTAANQNEWLEKAKTLPFRLLEKAVAAANPRESTPEIVSYVSAQRLSLSLGVEERVMIDFRRAQDQVSRSKGRPVSLEETLTDILSFYLERKDPLLRARRSVARKGFSGPVAPKGLAGPTVAREGLAGPTVTAGPTVVGEKDSPAPTYQQVARIVVSRTQLPASLAHTIRIRDQGRCQFTMPNGQLCGDRRWTDFHHIRPVAEGGEDTVENLITLCRTHHQEHHRRVTRLEGQERQVGLEPPPPELPLL